MPRSKQGIKRPPVDVNCLKTAIEDVLKRKLSVGKAAQNNSVSTTTLLWHLHAHKASNKEEFTYISNSKYKQIFNEQEELMLADYVLTAAKLHYGLSKETLAKLAYQFGSANRKNFPSMWSDEGKAGPQWVHISVPAINLAKQNGIILLTMLPHTSHKLQPLDRTLFGPCKIYYAEACNHWMTNNPGKTIFIYDVAELVGKAYSRAFTISNIVKGFSVTGICPYNDNIFRDDESLSSYVTDRPYGEIDNASSENVSQNKEPEAGPSGVQTFVKSVEDIVSPEIVRPFPKASPRKQERKTRTKGKTRFLTDTPNKNEIEEQKRCKIKRPATKTKVQMVKRKLLMDSSSSSDESLHVVLEDSSSDEEFLSNLNKSTEMDENENQPDERKFSKGDYVLVKLAGRKHVAYFVAEINEILVDGYEVMYYKRIFGTTAVRTFIPSTETSFINAEDVVMPLLNPTKVASSNRQAAQICFDVDFSMYKVL